MDAHGTVPAVRWLEGWRLAPSAWGGEGDPRWFLTMLATPGELGPGREPRAWSLHVDGLAAAGKPLAVLLANGFRLSFQGRGGRQDVICVVPESGVVVGSCPTWANPVLFAPEIEIAREDGATWIADGDSTVALAMDRSGAAVRFALVARSGARAEALAAARRHLADDAERFFDAECERRAPFWEAHDVAEFLKPALAASLEVLVSRLRAPRGVLPCRWSSAGRGPSDVLDTRETFPLAAAWSAVDPAVAKDIVKSALSCQGQDGLVPATWLPEGPRPPARPGWPLFAQAARTAWEAGPNDPAFLDYVVPRLALHVDAALRYYDPHRLGSPSWPSAEEAFIPETFDRRLAAADLAAFLLGEIDALLELGQDARPEIVDRSALTSERDRLGAGLENLWNPGTRCFQNRYLGGARVERISLSALTPLAWTGLPASYRNELLAHLRENGAFYDRHGIPLWLKWAGDAEPPPIRAAHQSFILCALRRAGASGEANRLSADLARSLAARFGRDGALPEDLRPAGGEAGGLPAADSACAALAVLLARTPEAGAVSGSVRPSLRWLERHSRLVAGAAAAAVVMACLVVTAAFARKRTMTARSVEVLSALARQQYLDGRYDQAIVTYRQLLVGTAGSKAVELLLANALFRKGDYAAAEAAYRDLLEKQPDWPPALMNLGLTLCRQGRLDESAEVYRRCGGVLDAEYPYLAARARTALALIQDRVVLLRAKAGGEERSDL